MSQRTVLVAAVGDKKSASTAIHNPAPSRRPVILASTCALS
jgi:hypothetical protein